MVSHCVKQKCKLQHKKTTKYPKMWTRGGFRWGPGVQYNPPLTQNSDTIFILTIHTTYFLPDNPLQQVSFTTYDCVKWLDEWQCRP